MLDCLMVVLLPLLLASSLLALFFLDYLAIMGLFSIAGYYGLKLLPTLNWKQNPKGF